MRRGWALAGVACVVLLAGAAAMLRGQAQTAAKTGGQAGETAANSSQTGAKTGVAALTAAGPGAHVPGTNAAGTNTQQAGKAQTGGAASGDAQSQQVEQQAAEMLKMANDLQAEMNKTRPDTLSLAVVRKASEIEQLAKKMRGQP